MPKLVEGSRKLDRRGSLFCTEDGSIVLHLSRNAYLLNSVRYKSNYWRRYLIFMPERLSLDKDDDHNYHWGPQKAKMIDHEVLSNYNMLPFERQAELAKDLEMTPSEIISVWDDTILDTRFL
ncbi:hypothetical protein Tco_0985773 [Tanacetum coccineum]